MAPWDQLSTKDRSMVHSKSEMLFELLCKRDIWIPLQILSFIDLKILKIGLEMAELAIHKNVPFGHSMSSKSRDERTKTDFRRLQSERR